MNFSRAAFGKLLAGDIEVTTYLLLREHIIGVSNVLGRLRGGRVNSVINQEAVTARAT